MTGDRFRFGDFTLDCANRRLTGGDGAPVEISARYLDALILLVRADGGLVSKDRFMAEVWRGVPVTDEALTQGVRALRRQLGDDAAAPRFIETVPKHGYRFIAAVLPDDGPPSHVVAPQPAPVADGPSPLRLAWRDGLNIAMAGVAGAVVAGIVGGICYGMMGASLANSGTSEGIGEASVLLVLLCVTTGVAILGGVGVASGIGAARVLAGTRSAALVLGGALGGLLVGAFVKLVASDGFRLLVGHAPGDVTGAGEGAVLGAAIGLGAWLAVVRNWSWRRAGVGAAACGAIAGVLIVAIGGHLLAGSLDLLVRSMPGARLNLDGIGATFGEVGLGPVSQAALAALEGALFAGCVVAAIRLFTGSRTIP